MLAVNKTTREYTHPLVAHKSCKYECASCKKGVILKQGEKYVYHFAHKAKDPKCKYYEQTTLNQKHRNAQLILKQLLENNRIRLIYRSCNRCSNRFAFDIESITITTEIKIEHRFKYNNEDKIADIARLDKGDIHSIFEVYNTHSTDSDARPEPWYEIRADEINDIDIRAENIEFTCVRSYECEDCVVKLVDAGTIYINQRGAGCGKTYEIVRLLFDPRFQYKNTFIYLTKQHSAKDVIYNELKTIKELDNVSFTISKDSKGRQYTLKITNLKTNKTVLIIIGTIDSFTFSLVNKDTIATTQLDHFGSINENITLGNVNGDGSTIKKYAKETDIIIRENSIVIIDEAQDLDNNRMYINAIETLVNKNKIDAIFIGDQLQSIWGENNIFTYIKKDGSNNLRAKFVESVGINCVRRFHNHHFKDFVNRIIPFTEYGLSPIQDICDGKCEYNHEDIIPYKVFEHPAIYEEDNIAFDIIELIIKEVHELVKKHNYLPHHFMFIFAILTGNNLARSLHERLQLFWKDIFKDSDYQTNVLSKDPYWQDKYISCKYHDFVIMHKSDEGSAINLQTSTHSSKILSIHASKGSGCEVVFVLDLSERALRKFSKSINLQYHSLLHVALTRQKKYLFVGLSCANDDLWTRFNAVGTPTVSSYSNISGISKIISCKTICDLLDDNDFIKIKKAIIDPQMLINRCLPKDNNPTCEVKECFDSSRFDEFSFKVSNKKEEKTIVDWFHHTIRYLIMVYKFILYLSQSNNSDKVSRFVKKFYGIQNRIKKIQFKSYPWKDYRNTIKQIKDNIKNHEFNKNTIFPLLCYSDDNMEDNDYSHYHDIIKETCENIQLKLMLLTTNELPDLCPYECIVHHHIYGVLNSSLNEFTIKSLYDLTEAFDSDVLLMDHKNKYSCKCFDIFKIQEKFINLGINRHFIKDAELRTKDQINKNIASHYDSIGDKLKDKCEWFKNRLDKKYKFAFNIYKPLLTDSEHHPDDENIKVLSYFDIFAQHIDEDTRKVFFISFKPSLSEINVNKTIQDMIIKTYMLKKSVSYCNHKVFVFIITLDSFPTMISIDLSNHMDLISSIIRSKISALYLEYNDIICKSIKDKSLADINKMIQKNESKLPAYIKKFLQQLPPSNHDINESNVKWTLKLKLEEMLNTLF